MKWSAPGIGGGAQPRTEYILTWKNTNENDSRYKIVTSTFAVIDNLSPNSPYEITVAVFGTSGGSNGEISNTLKEATRK